MRRRVAVVLGCAVVLAGCASHTNPSHEPPRPRPNSNQNPAYDAP